MLQWGPVLSDNRHHSKPRASCVFNERKEATITMHCAHDDSPTSSITWQANDACLFTVLDAS